MRQWSSAGFIKKQIGDKGRWQRKASQWHTTLAVLDWRHEYRLFVPILLFAIFVPWLMRFPLPKVSRMLRIPYLPPQPDEQQVQRILHCTDAVLALGRPLVQPRCLTRGVTLYYFLRKAGLPVELHFGVQQRSATLYAHCWLMLDDQPFAEPVATVQAFTVADRLPG